jgi:hypothetical protein
MSPNPKATEVGAGADRLRRFLTLAVSRLDPWAGRLAGLVLGLVGSWYGAAAGFLLGLMVDSVRSGRRLRLFLRKPDSPRPAEAFPGLAAATALALSPALPGPAGADERRTVLLAALRETRSGAPAASPALLERQLVRLFEAAAAEEGLPFEGLARDLATRGGNEAQALFAAYAYGLSASRSRDLDHDAELAIVKVLADSGCSAGVIEKARSRSFPGYRDPWDLLGVGRDAGPDEIKRAWRKKSRASHPDLAGAGMAGDFRALKSAYEYLKERSRP